MPFEIERKFLVVNDIYKTLAEPIFFRQGYIFSSNDKVVRVRIAGENAFITFKNKPIGIKRSEYEYEIPFSDAVEMLDNFCLFPQIEKYRYIIPAVEEGLFWEIDEFCGDNDGLVVAEIELPTEDFSFVIPSWLGKEVTGDVRYYNNRLCVQPYSTWKK